MTPYLGQLLLASFNFAPKGWFLCNGQTLAINSYTGAVFAAGNDIWWKWNSRPFQLPNLQGRTPVGVGNAINYGEISGEESHTLLSSEVPIHTHPLQAGAGANEAKPNGSILAGGGAAFFTGAANLTAMNSAITQPIRRQPAPRKPPALLGDELVHRLFRDLSLPQLEPSTGESNMSDPFVGQLSLVGFNFAPSRLGARPGPDTAHLAKFRSVFTAGNLLRRQRNKQLRASQPAELSCHRLRAGRRSKRLRHRGAERLSNRNSPRQ